MWNDHKLNAALGIIIILLVIMSFILVTIMLVQSPHTSFGTVLMRYIPLCFWAIVGTQLIRCSRNHVTTYECDECGALVMSPDISHRQHGRVVPMP